MPKLSTVVFLCIPERLVHFHIQPGSFYSSNLGLQKECVGEQSQMQH